MHASAIVTLLTVVALAVSSPVPDPEPAPIDPALAAVIASNFNLGCQHGCPGASSAQHLNTDATLDSALSVFGDLAAI